MAIDWEAQAARDRRDMKILDRIRVVGTPLSDDWAAVLSEREWQALTLHFKNRLTFEKAGKIMGVTRERVRQIALAAARKLEAAGLV
jgi:DNA-directed RNA polymerase sigma subunit (sigma70/sigma32)